MVSYFSRAILPICARCRSFSTPERRPIKLTHYPKPLQLAASFIVLYRDRFCYRNRTKAAARVAKRNGPRLGRLRPTLRTVPEAEPRHALIKALIHHRRAKCETAGQTQFGPKPCD